jgi:hypothetical protein
MDTYIETNQNPPEINFGSANEFNNQPYLNQDNIFTQDNSPNNMNLLESKEVADTIYDPNAIINQETKIDEKISNIPNIDLTNTKDGERSYTFNGLINFDSNFETSPTIENTNLDLFTKKNHDIQLAETTNTQIITQNTFEEPKTENINTNLNIDNLNTNTTGNEGNFTFDANLFDINNNATTPEENYSNSGNIFSNYNFNIEGNNNIITNDTNPDNNINNIINNNYIQTDYTNIPNVNLLNAYTFGEKEQTKEPLINNPQTDFIENQNIYHENTNEQPKIENENLNVNVNTNNILGNEQKDKENLLNINIDDIHKKSPFEYIEESKTIVLQKKQNTENNNIPPQKLDTVPEIKIEEKKEEEINTNILAIEDSKTKKENEIQLTNNIPDNVQQPAKIEEKKEENKLVDISGEIKEIKQMPEKPFEQRDVIFNKNNIKVIKIEDDETTFCTGLFSPLFKKLFG